MTNGQASLSEVPFAALLTYSPRGSSDVSKKSRRVRDAVKNDTPPVIQRAVERLVSLVDSVGLAPFFEEDTTLVPVPRRAPLRDPNALWPSRRIAETLIEHGLGREVLPCLERKSAVRKSAYAAPGDRPTVTAHLRSMAVSSTLIAPERITLVDDFVTKGTTLLAAATLLRQEFPSAKLRGFALVRTMGFVPEIQSIVDPCVGRIWYEAGDVRRHP